LEVYARVRRAIQVDGMSIQQASREFGLARKTIRKMLAHSTPPGYERKKPITRPKLGPWLGVIDPILEDDKSQPKNNATLPNDSGSGGRPSMVSAAVTPW
jgi:helix-turn-helix, Psq domain